MYSLHKVIVILVVFFNLIPTHTQAVVIGGVDFPDGSISFADSVISYVIGGDSSGLLPAVRNGNNALGAPDYSSSLRCDASTSVGCRYATLGDGGNIVVRFDDNVLTGSDDSTFDLWVFEVGTDVEDTFVEVSVDGITWTSVGKVFGATSGIDIDAFGFDTSSALRYVRLTDDPDEGQQSGAGLYVGADIDAVGAISTRFSPINISAPSVTLLSILVLIGMLRLHSQE